jgi:tetratricopeptide (TPR) repeat protein
MNLSVRIALPLLLALSLFAPAPARAQARQDKKDTAVEPTSWGRVIGQIYDAATGAPIEGAQVTVREAGAYADSGRTQSATDSVGRYQCEGVLGRVSSNLDLGRALSSGIIGIIVGGATNTTKRIDVSQMTIRVQREGYHPFEGTVPCKRVDPERFIVTLEPVLLTPMSITDESTSAEGWGVVRIRDVSVDPPVLKPGSHAVVTIRVQSPAVVQARDLKIVCYSPLWGWRDLHEDEKASEKGTLVYTVKCDVARQEKARVGSIVAIVGESPYDIAAPGRELTYHYEAVRGSKTLEIPADASDDLQAAVLMQSGVVQVATNPDEEATGVKRMEALRAMQAGDNVAAAGLLKAICDSPTASQWDLETYARVSTAIHDSAAAASALKRVCDIAPEKQHLRAEGQYATALVAGGQAQQVLSDCEPEVAKIKEQDRPRRVPLALMVAIGQSYLQTNEIDKAEAIGREIGKWPDAGANPAVPEFRSALRLARAEAAVKAAPDSATAQADYGRVLMDGGRWEEAVDVLRTAAKLNPALPAVQRDLAYAELHVTSQAAATPVSLDQALDAAQQQVLFTDPHNKQIKSKDFFAWHALAMLQFAKAQALQNAHDPGAGEMMGHAMTTLREALKCGRSGAMINEGAYSFWLGYISSRISAVAGFAYPEANGDFVILESMNALRTNPHDVVALTDLGTALVDLGQPALASVPIQEALRLQSDVGEARYEAALIAARTGDRTKAEAMLKSVLAVNPRHPHANRTLARFYTEDGDTASAAGCLAAQAQYYGTSR